MSEVYNLKVEVRTEKGKSAARKLRRSDYVPGVYYDAQGDTIPLKIRVGPFYKAWTRAGSTSVVELEYSHSGKTNKKPCLIWSVDKHPFKKIFMHVDFYGVDLTKEITVSVPVDIQGTAKGAEDGGVMEIYRHYLDLTCLPANIPSQVLIDVSHLKIGDNVHVEDIKLPAGARAVYEENFALVGLAPPMRPEEEALPEEEEETAGEEEAPMNKSDEEQ